MFFSYINVLMLVFGIGIAAWIVGYRKMLKIPSHDRLRGMLCVPAVILILIAVIMFAFYWHWVAGGVIIGLLVYGAYKMVAS